MYRRFNRRCAEQQPFYVRFYTWKGVKKISFGQYTPHGYYVSAEGPVEDAIEVQLRAWLAYSALKEREFKAVHEATADVREENLRRALRGQDE